MMLKRVRVIADYQFGKGAGEALFPDNVKFILSRTGRVRQIIDGDKRVATVRANDGFLILSTYGGQKLKEVLPFPQKRVIMNDDAAPFVAKGKTAFAKFVLDCDPEIRALEEVLLVDKDDNLLGTGQARLSAQEMKDFNKGTAVIVRYGVKGKEMGEEPSE
ncbi:pseudouridine synthase [Methanocella sp. CWC-04]|uniref:Pseudouridine synthase n=1 Tax=Methanooceanicella nereidis TaxID=2052831 RepID=A0AAP2RF18_9EURY|nr:PUA domain-containing protein [Methanocella sp. CWC-04]MCD1295927.1 pseudouridine synthase [Methanocella sp. CWC-04]